MTKKPEDRRSETVEVSLTKTEKLEIAAAAEAKGLGVGTFMRAAALRVAQAKK